MSNIAQYKIFNLLSFLTCGPTWLNNKLASQGSIINFSSSGLCLPQRHTQQSRLLPSSLCLTQHLISSYILRPSDAQQGCHYICFSCTMAPHGLLKCKDSSGLKIYNRLFQSVPSQDFKQMTSRLLKTLLQLESYQLDFLNFYLTK